MVDCGEHVFDSTRAAGGFDAAEGDGRERQVAEHEQQRALDVLRAASLRRMKRTYRMRRNVLAQSMNDAISVYVRACEAAALDTTRKKMRMVTSLRREDRYRAFLVMESREELLKRVGQTIDAAEAMMEINSPERFAAYYAAAANDLVDRVSVVGRIEFAPAFEEGADDEGSSDFAGTVEEGEDAISDVIEGVYASFFDKGMESVFDIVRRHDRHQRGVDEIDEVERRATAEVEKLVRSNARCVAGKCVGAMGLPALGDMKCRRVIGLAQLEHLLAEVRTSYASYIRCVRQGGLPCAFGPEFGLYSVHSTIMRSADDRSAVLMDGYENYDGGFDIPDFYDEDAHIGGDDIATAIERMRKFNAEPFRDVLIDDPAEHARRFWYGLKKLLVFAEGAVEVDERQWDVFIDRIEFATQQAMAGFAGRMDANQVAQFRHSLDSLLEPNE